MRMLFAASMGLAVRGSPVSHLQAARGQPQYTRACASCHAADLRGGSTVPSLVEESLSFQWADTTVGELSSGSVP